MKIYLPSYKYGKPILSPSGEEGSFDRYGVDNMRICRHNGKFYMFYIGFDGKGYRTACAVSEDLLHWEKKGVVLDAGSGIPWDSNGRAISSLLADVDLYGSRELIRRDGKYWMFYHAYPDEGYEAGAAANGLANYTPLYDIAEFTDIANAAWYFGSDESRNTTGAELIVDGGMLAQLTPNINRELWK